MRILVFIITAMLAFSSQASSAPIAESPPFTTSTSGRGVLHPAPNDIGPAEQAKPAPTIDQACLGRLGAAGIEFEVVTVPLAAKPGCAIETPVRLKAVKLASRWRTSIGLPDVQ